MSDLKDPLGDYAKREAVRRGDSPTDGLVVFGYAAGILLSLAVFVGALLALLL